MPFDFSLVTAPFRMHPGLRRVAAGAPQLTPALPNSRHLREKMAVLASFPAQALRSVPGFDALPVLAAAAAEAARSEPVAFSIDGQAAHAPLLGWSVRGGEPHGEGDPAIGALLAALAPPQRATALLCLAFEEDFAVLDGATSAVPWLAVCLPSRWAPADKVGLHFAEIHGPVADSSTLVAASEPLARLVTGRERWERFVWTISADPKLNQHPAQGRSAWPGDVDADTLVALATFRSERQTFVPMEGSPCALFTIHVDSVPLAVAIDSPQAAIRVHDAVASMSDAVLAYRGLEDARERLLAWLAARARSPSPR